MNIFFESALWFFAVFGLIEFLKFIVESIGEFFAKNDDPLIVVKVKNQQDEIEGIIRSLVWDSLNKKKGRHVPNVLAVDLGSTDETREILDRLSYEYTFIAVTDEMTYNEFIGEEEQLEE